MAKTPATQPGLFAAAPFAFADRFLQDHAGQIISEPRTAILELIANSYDAGASKSDIIWPTENGQKFSVADGGIGMTKAEFEKRWRTLCYDREAEQGNAVVFLRASRESSGRLSVEVAKATRPILFCRCV